MRRTARSLQCVLNEVPFFLFDHEVSLCESIRFQLRWVAQFTQWLPSLSCFSSGKPSMYLREAKMHGWFTHDQFASHPDKLFARVEVSGCCSELQASAALCGPNFLSSFSSPTCRTSKSCFLKLNRRKPNILAQKSPAHRSSCPRR